MTKNSIMKTKLACLAGLILCVAGCDKKESEPRYIVTSSQWTDFYGKSFPITIKLDATTGKSWQLTDEMVPSGPADSEGVIHLMKDARGQPLMYQRWVEINDEPLKLGR